MRGKLNRIIRQIVIITVLTVASGTIANLYGPRRIEFIRTPYEHDFGLVPQGQILSWEFQFANPKNHDIRIEDISSDCYCAAINRMADVIPPGEVFKIAAVVDTSMLFEKAGSQLEKHIRVYTDSEDFTLVTLFRVAAFAEVKPIKPNFNEIDFAQLSETDELPRVTVEVSRLDEGAAVESVTTAFEYFAVEVVEQNPKTLIYDVVLSPDAPAGPLERFKPEVEVKYADGKAIRIPVIGTVLGNVRLECNFFDTIDFGKFTQPKTEECTVTWLDGTFSIDGIDYDRTLFDVSWQAVEGQRQVVLKVQVLTTEMPKGVIEQTITIRYNQDQQLSISIMGFYGNE